MIQRWKYVKRLSPRVYIFFPPVIAVVNVGYFLKVKQLEPNVIPDAVKDLTAMFIKPRSRPTSGLSWTDSLFYAHDFLNGVMRQ